MFPIDFKFKRESNNFKNSTYMYVFAVKNQMLCVVNSILANSSIPVHSIFPLAYNVIITYIVLFNTL